MRVDPRALAIASAALLAAAGCGSSGDEEGAGDALGFDPDAPNVVVVLTDDQAPGTMRAMPAARRLLGGGGVTFEQAVASFPLCCPSRATLLTGQYAHNHGVLDNGPPLGGYAEFNNQHTLAVWLSRAGYRTAHVGKYLNGYGKHEGGGDREVPPGWSEWYGALSEAKQHAYGYSLNHNGEIVAYGERPADYKTDVFADLAVEFVRRAAPSDRPFFLHVATTAPHTDNDIPRDRPNPVPAPRHQGLYEDVELERNQAFDERDVGDKPAWVQALEPLRPVLKTRASLLYRGQLAALRAVDDMIGRLVAELRRAGELENTVLVFTSDNGLLLGQHRILGQKNALYEEAIGVPLLVRGPGFPRGLRSDQVVSNADIAPTILEAAGADADVPVDGSSLGDLSRRPDRDRAVLVEVLNEGPRFTAVRTRRYVYAEYESGDRELYDLRRDPLQLRNVAGTPGFAAVEAELAATLDRLRDCAGHSCR
jgi:N-acetylglucosamine-6-sulfatase